MAYIKTTWENEPSESTPLNASNLNKIEEGIYQNSINIETTNENINNITGQILWTNSSPTSSFSAQTITLSDSLSNYDTYEILYIYNLSSNDMLSTGQIISGNGTRLQAISAYPKYRLVNSASGTSVVFDTCYSTNVAENTSLIPLYVIGYKTGLFSV